MKNLGWVKFPGEDEFWLLRPFHRVFDKCLELSATKCGPGGETPSTQTEA